MPTMRRLPCHPPLSSDAVRKARGYIIEWEEASFESPVAHSATDLIKSFASLLSSTDDAAKTYENNVASSLTIFCPTDATVDTFEPVLKNLSANATLSLLLYHAIHVYESLQTLRSTNGVANTLASDGTICDFNLTIQNDGEAVTPHHHLHSRTDHHQ